MPYCGTFGCGCCSKNCEQCGKTSWHKDLEDGVCPSCRLQNLKDYVEAFLSARDRNEDVKEEIEHLKKAVGYLSEDAD